MPLRDVFKISRKTFFNPRGWFDLDSLADQNRTIWAALQALVAKPVVGEKETFDEAMKRQNLTEPDIKKRCDYFKTVAMCLGLLGLCLFLYAFYLIFKHVSFTGWLLSMGASGVFFAKAFQYDFWALQLERRQLGLTFADWKAKYLGK